MCGVHGLIAWPRVSSHALLQCTFYQGPCLVAQQAGRRRARAKACMHVGTYMHAGAACMQAMHAGRRSMHAGKACMLARTACMPAKHVCMLSVHAGKGLGPQLKVLPSSALTLPHAHFGNARHRLAGVQR